MAGQTYPHPVRNQFIREFAHLCTPLRLLECTFDLIVLLRNSKGAQHLKYWYYPGLLLLAAHLPLAAGTVTLDFEGFPDGTVLTTEYPGITFTNAIILSADISLNEFEAPPHSGTNVASDNNGPMTITFASPAQSFGGYFTYYEPLTAQAFDSDDIEVASAHSLFSINVGCDPGPVCLGDPGSTPNEFLFLSSPSGISSVTIAGDLAGGSFALDDALITPEPGTFFLILPIFGCAVLIRLCQRRFPS